MVKGKLERKYKLIHNGRELSQGLLSEAGKYDAMQILVQRFDEGLEGAIDPDEVEVIDVTKEVMEVLILLGGCYALYTVGMAIATHLDYREVNRK